MMWLDGRRTGTSTLPSMQRPPKVSRVETRAMGFLFLQFPVGPRFPDKERPLSPSVAESNALTSFIRSCSQRATPGYLEWESRFVERCNARHRSSCEVMP